MSGNNVVKKLLYTLPSTRLVEDILGFLKRKNVDFDVAGYTHQGKPVYVVRLGRGDSRLLVIAGIHGNEPAPINASLLTALMLAERRSFFNPYFDVKKYLDNTQIVIVPVANPEGLDEYRQCTEENDEPSWSNVCSSARTNNMGYDLNRDWAYLSQVETRILHKIINNVDPHLVLDLHEFYAGENSPPYWASKVVGFMVTLTDTPYMWVNEFVEKASYETMKFIAENLKAIMGRGWPIKYRHFVGGAVGEKPVASPAIMGSHIALEGYPKVLVETWGIGLHKYLFEERVMVHVSAMLSATEFLIDNKELFISAKEDHLREDQEVYGMSDAKFVIEGRETIIVEEVLKTHMIDYTIDDGKIIVPRSKKRARMALILLDKECGYNKKLVEARKGPYTLDRFYDVVIKRI